MMQIESMTIPMETQLVAQTECVQNSETDFDA